MPDITDFLCTRKEQYIEKAKRCEEKIEAIKKSIANNENAYGEIAGYPKAIIPDEHGREQLQSVISKQNELLAKAELIEELLELEDYRALGEQGKLLKLPCMVGDTVYEVQAIRKRIQPYEITAIKIGRLSEVFYYWEINGSGGVYGNLKGFENKRLGKDVFLTKSEAESALQKAKETEVGYERDFV